MTSPAGSLSSASPAGRRTSRANLCAVSHAAYSVSVSSGSRSIASNAMAGSFFVLSATGSHFLPRYPFQFARPQNPDRAQTNAGTNRAGNFALNQPTERPTSVIVQHSCIAKPKRVKTRRTAHCDQSNAERLPLHWLSACGPRETSISTETPNSRRTQLGSDFWRASVVRSKKWSRQPCPFFKGYWKFCFRVPQRLTKSQACWIICLM